MVLVFLHRHQNFILYFIIHISFYIHLLSAWPKPKISESFLVASYTNHFKANYPLSFIRAIFLFTMTIIEIFYKVLHLFSYFYFIGTKTLQVWLPAGKQKILKKIDSFIMFSLVMYDFSPSYVWKWISLPIAVHTYCIK